MSLKRHITPPGEGRAAAARGPASERLRAIPEPEDADRLAMAMIPPCGGWLCLDLGA
jgi:hypothetical protein